MQVVYTAPAERLKCPSYFQDRIKRAGGLNRYSQPNFKIAWAQTETTRQGGEWEAEGETFIGYHDVLLGDGLPHWMLLKWCDAGMSIDMPDIAPESPNSFYHDNRCTKTGLQLLGEYPHKGSYQIALSLVAKWFEGEQLHLDAFPLSHEIIDLMIPTIKQSMELSAKAKMKFMKEEKEKEETDRDKVFEDVYKDVHRKTEKASTDWLEDKQRSIERAFNKNLVEKLHRNKVFQANERPK